MMTAKRNYYFACSILLLFMQIKMAAQPSFDYSPIEGTIPCILPEAPFEGHKYIPYIAPELSFRSGPTFTINYIPNGGSVYGYSCGTWPEDAQTALEYAASIWSSELSVSNEVVVDACWATNLPGGTLGAAGPTSFFYESNTDSYVPITVAEAVNGFSFNGSGADVNAIFNGNRSNWYYETDAIPGSLQYDFVTVALHELGHGLGFLGVEGYNGSSTDCSGSPAGHGCLGFGGTPDIYSRMVETSTGSAITNFGNPSSDLGDYLTGSNGGLYLNSNSLQSGNGGPARIYTPSSYTSGSTYSHFHPGSFSNELMKPSLPAGQAIHNPGLAGGFLEDLGWSGSLPNLTLPVELLSFEAAPDKWGVQLSWEIGTATNNQLFNIYRSGDGVTWNKIGQVAGVGTADQHFNFALFDDSPLPGRNYYRLAEVDFTDHESFLKTITYTQSFDDQWLKVTPNPAQNELQLKGYHLDEKIDYQIVNNIGQVILHGQLDPEERTIIIDTLPKGMYYLITPFERHSFLKS